MKHTIRQRMLAVVAALIVLAGASVAQAQTQTTITTNNGAQTQAATTMTLTSATAAAVGVQIYIDLELETITAVNGSVVTVQRGQAGTLPAAHATSTSLLIGTPDHFQSVDPPIGPCTQTQYPGNFKPWVNVTGGNLWLCRAATNLWVGTNTMNLTYNSLTQQ